MIVLVILVLVVLVAVLALIFLLRFRLGGDGSQSELSRMRLEASQAERRLHDLTRQAFVSMAEAVEERHKTS